MEAFGKIDAKTLESLFQKALKACKFFPKIAEILEPLQAAEQADFEDEWQALLDYCREWVNPDIHFSGAPRLPVEIDHAARAAGGVRYLRACSSEELAWRKKAFIEDLQRSRKTGDLAVLLNGGELRNSSDKLLPQLRFCPIPSSPRPQLSPRERAWSMREKCSQSWPCPSERLRRSLMLRDAPQSSGAKPN